MPRGRWGTLATAAALLVIAGALMAGCGDEDPPPGLSDRQARSLIAQLDEARAAANLQDVAATEAALDGFRSQVARLRRSGRLSDEAARALRTGAARVLERARSDVPPPPEPAPQPEPVVPVPEGDGEKDDDEKGKDEKKKDEKKGNGKDKGEEGDD
jgi:hypothetical protein